MANTIYLLPVPLATILLTLMVLYSSFRTKGYSRRHLVFQLSNLTLQTLALAAIGQDEAGQVRQEVKVLLILLQAALILQIGLMSFAILSTFYVLGDRQFTPLFLGRLQAAVVAMFVIFAGPQCLRVVVERFLQPEQYLSPPYALLVNSWAVVEGLFVTIFDFCCNVYLQRNLLSFSQTKNAASRITREITVMRWISRLVLLVDVLCVSVYLKAFLFSPFSDLVFICIFNGLIGVHSSLMIVLYLRFRATIITTISSPPQTIRLVDKRQNIPVRGEPMPGVVAVAAAHEAAGSRRMQEHPTMYESEIPGIPGSPGSREEGGASWIPSANVPRRSSGDSSREPMSGGGVPSDSIPSDGRAATREVLRGPLDSILR